MADTLGAVMEAYARRADAAVDGYLDVGEHPTLKEAMRWIPMAGGKRLRPVLCSMVGEAVGGARGAKATVPLGTALEVIHNFTLVHDDIMDRSELRRGRRTVHLKWDEATAINAGDALFARAFEVLLDTPCAPALQVEVIGEVAQMVRRIAEGQQWDMQFERARAVTRPQYLHMIEFKTALMFSTGAYCASRVAGAPRAMAGHLREYGRLMGISFQIQDDILDLTASQEALGKPIGKDLRNGKRTVMVIDALESLTGKDRQRFRSVLGNPRASAKDIDEVVALLQRCGAIRRAKAMAGRLGDQARAHLKGLKPTPARERLAQLVTFVTARAK
jgi:geranylgeranyl diphosphate synthase type I